MGLTFNCMTAMQGAHNALQLLYPICRRLAKEGPVHLTESTVSGFEFGASASLVSVLLTILRTPPSSVRRVCKCPPMANPPDHMLRLDDP